MITGLIGAISTVMTSTITETEMYWLTRLDYFHGMGTIIGVALLIIGTLWIICGVLEWGEGGSKWGFFTGIIPVITSLLILVGACFIPTTKEMCAIKAIPMIVNNKQVQELPNKVVELASEWIDELKPSNNK